MKKLLMITAVCAAISAMADAPELFRYQGRLVDGTTLVNASLPMSFKLHDAETGGTLLYEDSATVQVVDGLYSAFIGDDTVYGSLTAALDHPAVYLELTIDGDTLSPRERLVSSPYALQTAADATPAGTIVLSETFPNTQLEAEGYSLYYEDPTQADWKDFETPALGPGSSYSFCFGNQVGLLMSGTNVYLTADGKTWDRGSAPLYFADAPEIVDYNDTLYFFERNGATCSTADLQSWNTWTNQFGTNAMDSYLIDAVVVFDNALFAFVNKDWDSQKVMRSTDGINWIKVSDGAGWYDLSMYSNSKVFSSGGKLCVNAQDSGMMTNYLWSSTDGISWNQSASSTPVGTGINYELVHFDNALWSFVYNVSIMSAEAWKSVDNGDSWSQVAADFPNYDAMGSFRVYAAASLDNHLWFCGGPDSGTMIADIFYSPDGISYTQVQQTYYTIPEDALELISLPNGKLFFWDGDEFHHAGGPKKQDGLYYYKKD